jgi:8-oxo-dGTP diphosphatase
MTPYQKMDWTCWQPVERATLLFAIRDDQVLLIHKKRGLGAGKINGPGGRLDPGETSAQCAVREVQEEVGVTPTTPRLCGELQFQFVDGHSIHGLVYRADDIEGDLQETDEAIPFWCPLTEIPYGKMWMDDRLWFPLMLENRYFTGRFLFDDDLMLGCEIIPHTAPPPTPPF